MHIIDCSFNMILYCSQKRKSEDLNGDAVNGQKEVKKEDDVDEVTHISELVMFRLLIKPPFSLSGK